MRKHGFFIGRRTNGWTLFLTLNCITVLAATFADQDYGEAIRGGAFWEDLEPATPAPALAQTA